MKKNMATTILIILLTVVLVSPVEANVSNGAPCQVAGQVDAQITGNLFFFYTCKKSNSKLVWSKINFPSTAYSSSSPNYKKLIENRSSVVYPGQGKKCVVNDCALGSVGPGGGIVFYDAGSLKSWGRFLEVAPNGWSGRGKEDINWAWCNTFDMNIGLNALGNINTDSKIIPITGQSIGLGKALTSKMLEKCPLGAALPISNYVGGNTADWYLPSVDELNELCKFSFGQVKTTPDVRCDSVGNPRGDFAKYAYWSSSQANAKGVPVPAAFISSFAPSKVFGESGTYVIDPFPNGRPIRPIRAFGSAAQSNLVDAGVIQIAGFGESNWPAQCPLVIDSLKSEQPQVMAIKFGNSDSVFSRIKDASSTAVATPANLIGCYANFGELKNGGNFYSVGSINRDKSGYFWQNAGGDTVGGRIRLTLNGSALISTTGDPETITLIK